MENKRYGLANTVMMIRPVAFDLNEQTLDSNAFQTVERSQSPEVINAAALAEFDRLVGELEGVGVRVVIFEDTPTPPTPDSVFPNNWVSFHADGTVMLYPMQAPNRRLERRHDILDMLQSEYGYGISYIHNFWGSEKEGRFLEGTGSMVLDRANKVAYACISPRTDPELFARWCEKFGCKPVSFNAYDQDHMAVYHTNVMMCLGVGFAVLCLDCITDPTEQAKVKAALGRTGHEIIPISMGQMNHFAGNMLQLRNHKDETVLAMSRQALDSLEAWQVERFRQLNDHVIAPDVATIERYGGGSVRCMLAELFLPPKPKP